MFKFDKENLELILLYWNIWKSKLVRIKKFECFKIHVTYKLEKSHTKYKSQTVYEIKEKKKKVLSVQTTWPPPFFLKWEMMEECRIVKLEEVLPPKLIVGIFIHSFDLLSTPHWLVVFNFRLPSFQAHFQK